MNLVLGAVSGLDIAAIRPFLYSLHSTSFQGEVALLVSNTDAKTLQELNKLGVITFEMPLPFPMQINSHRYFAYQAFLAEHGNRYRHILLTDVRDVFFQHNPFDISMPSPLNCFLEDKRTSIGTSSLNTAWVAAGYGKKTLKMLRDKAISCSGVTLGTSNAIQAYTAQMTQELMAVHRRTPNLLYVIIGLDQGVHNVLLYSHLLDATHLFSNEDGPVLTMGYMQEYEFVYSEQGELCNAAGKAAHILHQYDRFPKIPDSLIATLQRNTTTETTKKT